MEPRSEVGGRSEAAFPAFVAEAVATEEAAFPAFIAQAAARSEAAFHARCRRCCSSEGTSLTFGAVARPRVG